MAKELKKYLITFHGEGGDVEVGHNFKLNLYKRNVPVEIDENFLGVVKHAVVHTISDGKPVSLPQYQYSVEPV